MHLQPYQADRSVFVGRVHRRERHVGGVDDRDRAASHHGEHVVGAYDGRRVLVESHADAERVVGEGGEQSAETVTLPKMLIDDHLFEQPEARCQRDHVRTGRGSLLPERDHVLGHERRSSRRAGHGRTRLVQAAQGEKRCGLFVR